MFVAHRAFSSFDVPSGNKIMDFDLMKINIGGDFDENTGIFTCRIPGLYFFAINLMKYGQTEYIWSYLQHNGVNVARVISYGSGSYYSSYATVGHSTIVPLNKGDEVYIRVYGDSHIRFSTDGETTFTGYLVQETTSMFISDLTKSTRSIQN